MRRSALAGALALATAIAAPAASAQEPVPAPPPGPPTLTLSLGASQIAAQGAPALAAGPTRLEFVNTGARRRAIVVLAVKPGVTLADFRQRLARARRASDVARFGSFESGVALGPRGRLATTLTLRTGTYLVLDTSDNDLQGVFRRSLARGASTVLTVGDQASLVPPPLPSATIAMRDYRFEMPATLPVKGTLRFENRGRQLHYADFVRLRRGASEAAIRRSLRRGERMVRGTAAYTPIGLVSPGTVNDVEYDFRAPGRYAVVCYYDDGGSRYRPHSQLGMVKFVTVR